MNISKQTIFSAILILCLSGAVSAQKLTREEYVERYKDIAIAHMEYYGIPASITLAQGILESGNGNSTLAREANNHFGIKCHTDWTGRRYYYDDDRPKECFRVYKSAEQSFTDHAEFLSNHRQSRYDSLFVYRHDDYASWARGLKAAGYATAPDYAERLIKIIEDNKLYLLDRENGEKLYAAALRGEDVESAAGASSSDGGAAVADVKGGDAPLKADYHGMGGHRYGRLLDPDSYRVTVNAYKGHDIYRSNHVEYVIAQDGETYASLGSLFRVSAKRLRNFNDVAADAELSEGDVVYIERKRKRWEGAQLLHTVYADEESLYSVSQNYGIRLKPLARLNKVSTDATFLKGRTIKLR